MEIREQNNLDLSIVMPCLNESATVGICVKEAESFLRKNHLSGEILVVDNGSTDGSGAIAARFGAKVIREPGTGYGNAMKAGIAHSRGAIILMGDCDTTYDFLQLAGMYRLLRDGWDMVIGNRFAGRIEKGSMPVSHKWGVRGLSRLGNLLFRTNIADYHCGLRGMTRQTAEILEFRTEGMEFAAEMIVEAAKNGLRIGQCPVDLRRCVYPRKSKLRTIRDGMRHLAYMIQMYLLGGK